LAPYPQPDATFFDAALARYFAVQAFASYCRLNDHPCWRAPEERGENGKPAGAYAEALRGFNRDGELAWTQYAATYLLRARAGFEDLPIADALRREVDSAELASETVGEWLIGYGIDAEVIVQAVRAERRTS
jgi:hypothetical protein